MRIIAAPLFLFFLFGLTLSSQAQRMQLRPEFPEKQKTAEPAKPVPVPQTTEAPKPANSKLPEAPSTPATAPAPASKKSDKPDKPEKKESTEAAAETPKRVNVRWYGQSFVYLTTTTGVRVAIDPYGESTVTYPFPPRLSADVVLISNESEAYSSAERIFGSPLVFRSITSIGLNRASGFTFKGVHTYKDREKGRRSGTNTIYTFTLDEVRFAHLGCLGHPLDSRIREEIGYVDVLFVPVGLKTLAVEEWRRIAKELQARVIVPVAYKSNFNANIDLRPLDEFLQGETNVVTLKSDQFDISHQELPVEPAIYIPQYP